MAVEKRTYVGDTPLIKADMGEVITGATGLKFYAKRPVTKDIVEWTPSISGTNYLQYQSVTDDIDEAGVWKVQPELTLGSFSGRGRIFRFTVYAVLAADE